MRLQFLATVVVALTLTSIDASAGTFPEKSIRIIVGFPAGSTGDLIVRILSPHISKDFGQPVIVENQPGAGSSIAAEAVTQARPDGYTLLLSTTANVINQSLYPDLRFNFARDLAPVTLVAEAPIVLISRPDFPWQTVKGLVAAASQAPGKFSYGSSGYGTITHLYGELFSRSAHIQLTHVPYKGSSQTLNDIIASRVDLSFSPLAPVLQQIRAGRIDVLAVIGGHRIASLPNVPTFAESGVAGLDSALWFGLNVPAATPTALVERLSAEINKVLADPGVRRQLAEQTVDAVGGTPNQFAGTIASESSKWSKLISTAGIKIH